MLVPLLYRTSDGHPMGKLHARAEPDSGFASIMAEESNFSAGALQSSYEVYVDVTQNPHVVVACATPTWTPSKANIVANGIDSSVLTGIPAGAQIFISDNSGGASLVADGTPLTITSMVPDTIEVVVFHMKWKVQMFSIGAA